MISESAPATPESELPARPLWRGRTLAVLGIVLFAFSLRSAVAALSPVMAEVQADFSVPTWVVGLIGTAPPVCFAVFALITPAIERRFGLERLAVVVMAIVAIALVARAFSPNAAMLLASTTLLFAAVGVGNVLTPPLVKTYFPDRIGLMTAVYSAVMGVATFVPALIAVPVSDASSWRLSVGMWAVFALAAIVPWVTMLVRERHAAVDIAALNPSVIGRLFRLPTAWALAISFAVSSATVYTLFAWLPALLTDVAGVTPAAAGALLSLFAAMSLPVSFAVPIFIRRRHGVEWMFAVAVMCGLAGLAGLLFAPETATWLWVALWGILPLLFPLMLVLIGLRSRTHEGAVALSGFVQSIAYGIAALFPLTVALLHESTDSWTVALWVMVGLTLCAIPAGVVAARPHTVEDEWERRHGSWS